MVIIIYAEQQYRIINTYLAILACLHDAAVKLESYDMLDLPKLIQLLLFAAVILLFFRWVVEDMNR